MFYILYYNYKKIPVVEPLEIDDDDELEGCDVGIELLSPPFPPELDVPAIIQRE